MASWIGTRLLRDGSRGWRAHAEEERFIASYSF